MIIATPNQKAWSVFYSFREPFFFYTGDNPIMTLK